MLFAAGPMGRTRPVLIHSKRPPKKPPKNRTSEGETAMKTLRVAGAGALLIASTGIASAQTTLRIGLAEDPDILDPTLARTYVGRIVFASFCDKLFDIDEKLNVVPQLALGYEIPPDPLAMTINLRSNVKFHESQKFDGEAARFSLERHMPIVGSVREPVLA